MANDKFYGYKPKSGKDNVGIPYGEDLRFVNQNPYEFRKGMDYELTSLGCSRLQESTPEEREKATESVLKNLEEHGGYYTALITYETLFRNTEGNKPSFKTWLKEQEANSMTSIDGTVKGFDLPNSIANNAKDTNKHHIMTEPKYDKKDYTVSDRNTSPLKEGSVKMLHLKNAIRNEIKNAIREQDEDDFDTDTDKADKAASKGAKKAKVKSGNRFDLEKEAIKDLLYRGKKGKESEFTEDEPAPKSILDIKNKMLELYKAKYKGEEGGADKYNEELKKANEKFEKIIQKHVDKFGEDGKGNKVTLKDVFGESLPATIKALGARLKAIDKEEQEEVIAKTSERRKIAETDMTREQHIKLLEIIKENGVSLREGAMGVKMYYEIAKASYLEGVANGMKL